MLTNTNTPLPSHAMITPQLRSRETGTTRPRATRRMCTAMLHAVESRYWTSMGVQRPNARTEIWLDVLNLDPGLCRPQGQVRRQSACSERAPQSASWTELPVAAATLWSTSHCMECMVSNHVYGCSGTEHHAYLASSTLLLTELSASLDTSYQPTTQNYARH